MTATPTTKQAFHAELVRICEIARTAGHLVPHSPARAAGVGTRTFRAYLSGAADPGNPWERDQILMDIVNKLQIRPV